jgi:putative transposase
VHYYSDALKPLIARRERLAPFLLRRDPRDISQVWALDPDAGVYLRVGYRMQSRPAISLWEQRAATSRLRELGRAEVDESALFAMVEQMREITDAATRSTRKARREHARRPASTHRARIAPHLPPPPAFVAGEGEEPAVVAATPFSEIEQW